MIIMLPYWLKSA